MLIEILLIIIAILYYQWLTSTFDYFEKAGIPYAKPYPFLGSFWRFLFKLESIRIEFLRICKKHQNAKAFGMFDGSNPTLVINDLELLKKITVKDFDHFKNHKPFTNPEDDPVFGHSIFIMKDEKWHDMRVTLSPAFSGSKLRLMHELIIKTSDKAVQYLQNKSKTSINGFDIEMKDFFLLFTNDAIASVAFGLDVNSLENPNSEFLQMAKGIFDFNLIAIIKMMLYQSFSSVFKLLGIKMYNEKFKNYFHRLVIDSMKYRKENNIVRPDMINMLMEAQNNPNKPNKREWTDDELVGQCAIFLFAGLESIATPLSFATQELIENLDIQEKLIEEIDSVNKELNGQPLTYDIVKKMKYMDMVVSEVLRKWPPSIQTDRVVSKTYTIDEDDLKIILRPGEQVIIPIVGLHMNENYFPNPEKFDPERFSEENKGNIKPLSYMPFGYGPRICIASSLALLEMKTILFYLLTNFKLGVSIKSIIPAELAPTAFPINLKNGGWLRMIPRK